MDKDTFRRLELLNQLKLTETEKADAFAFFGSREKERLALDKIDTSSVERMVHVMPIMTVVREDVAVQKFSREALQQGAPETDEGYWCVPRVVE
ncbi:MAG: Asp-tRNA(Asn)/Glu-tRNA(Gln) amidotransferase subunit GatC [Clostridia bacterium]|nr:Asp-tRNA(Asn)/Glu-tRNA(Gln) amidotransferase subunit GatC [Clostridia bacterium]